MANIRKRGNKWQAQVRRKGLPSLSRSFHLKRDAEEWARQVELQADRREFPQDRRVLEQVTLGELVVRYRDTICTRKRSYDTEKYSLKLFLRHPLASKRLSDVTASDFAAFRDERLQVVKPSSLKRQLSPLHHLFEVARDEWGLPIKENPLDKVRVTGSSQRRERRLKSGELEKLIEAARLCQNPYVIPIILLAIETGMRRGEIVSILWDHVNIDNRSLLIPHSKNGCSRTIPLTLPAVEILDELVQCEERVFPITGNAFRLNWQRVKRRAGFDDLHFHDLRHEAISRFFELGLTAPEVALISGHRDMRMLFRYAHPLREAILVKLKQITNYNSAGNHLPN